MRSSKKSKLALFASLGVSLVAVLSASVSTYAWFQASSNINIQTQSTSTTITVNKPDDYAFYAYKGNTNSNHTVQNSFTSDFTLIDSSNVSTETNLNGLNPGDVKTYCIAISNHDISVNVSLKITQITSNDINMQDNTKHRYIYETSTDINIGWAINIYSTYSTSNVSSAYSTFVTSSTGKTSVGGADGTDLFTYTNNNRSTYLAGTTSNNVVTLNDDSQIPLINQTINSSTIFIYYSIVFTNSNDTIYREVDSSGASVLLPTSDATRRFKLYNASDSALEQSRCNSNCYQGLTFALNSLALSF